MAILISVFSMLIAALSLGWNIYRDVVLKPKLSVSVAIKTIVGAGIGRSPEMVCVSATNFGPGSIKLNAILLKDSSLLRRITRNVRNAYIVHDYENPHTSELPIRLEVGESANYFFRYDQDCLLSESFTHVGLSDSFSRVHWASKRSFQKLRNRWLVDFAPST